MDITASGHLKRLGLRAACRALIRSRVYAVFPLAGCVIPSLSAAQSTVPPSGDATAPYVENMRGWLAGQEAGRYMSVAGIRTPLDPGAPFWGAKHVLVLALREDVQDEPRVQDPDSLIRRSERVFAHFANLMDVAVSDVGVEVNLGGRMCGEQMRVGFRFALDGIEGEMLSKSSCGASVWGLRMFGEGSKVFSLPRSADLTLKKPASATLESISSALVGGLIRYYEHAKGSWQQTSVDARMPQLQIRMRGVVIPGAPPKWEKVHVTLVLFDATDSIDIRYLVDGQWAPGLGTPHASEYRDMDPQHAGALSDHRKALVKILAEAYKMAKSGPTAAPSTTRVQRDE